jgi:hypothetical protein
LTCVGFDPGGVGGVDAGDVFEENVVDVVNCCGWVADGANDHAAGFVASDVSDVHVGSVTLGADAVLSYERSV